MPVEGPLPQTGDQHDINADADRCFRARSPRNWRTHGLEGTDDYGLDYQVQTTPSQRATDIFRVQLKGTRSPDISADGRFISIQLKASTIRYYDRLVEPILLVVCNLKADPEPVDCPLYYVWVRDELRRIDVSNLPAEQLYVTLRVPTQNRLTTQTELSADIDRQNELSRAGHAMDIRVEQSHPMMQAQERLNVIQGVTHGIAARSTAFIDALAAPVEEHWIAPSPGTLAWHLNQAKDALRTRYLDRGSQELDAAEAMLNGATLLEIADYWFMRGKWQAASGSDQAASDAFKRAHQANPIAKYLAVWAEAEILLRYQEDGPKPYPDLLEALVGEEPVVLLARSRVLAAEGKFEEAIAVADKISGPEQHAARALAHTMFSKSAEALADCDSGLALSDLPDNMRQMLLVLRARAKFSLAQASAPASGTQVLAPSGVAGIDPELVKEAWEAIEKSVDVLQKAGWSSNIEHVADIWATTASMLGKQKEVLPALAEAARANPHLKTLQGALESIAAQCGEFAIALEANERIPATQTGNLRRTLLLHEAQKHRACFQWFELNIDSFDRAHELLGPATMVAALSAHKMAQPELVTKLSAVLDSAPALREDAALLQYFLMLEQNKLGNSEALQVLHTRYEELGRPFTLAVALLQELNPIDTEHAPICVEVAGRVTEKVQLSPAMAAHLGLALGTIQDWASLLDLCRGFKVRADAGPRMLAFEALALDRLGYTEEARRLLERMLAGGVLDSLAMNTYVTIMVRCGYVQEALEAAEKILESTQSNTQRMDCIRLLFNLIQNADPTSKRLLALAVQMGGLADPDSEVQEGIYLMMFLMATSAETNTPSQQDVTEFRQRTDAFFINFPNSKMLTKGEVREDASPKELLAQLKEIIGITADREAFQARIENQLQLGLTVVPFSWRPKLVLSSVRDVVHLWEIAKVSGRDDRKFHLTMLVDPQWQPPSAASLRDRMPLLDLTALLVLFDLDLLNHVVHFFGKVAIAKATLETLATLANPFSGSPMNGKCTALQDSLKPHLSAIVQPSISNLPDDEEVDDEPLGREHKEITQLCRDKCDIFRLYSDDLAFRVFCAKSDTPDGICTLDVLMALEEVDLLTRDEVARKVSKLCEWRVGLVVRFQELAPLLPSDLVQARSVRQGIQILDTMPEFMSVISAIWDFRGRFEKTLEHAAAVLRRLADETSLPDVALAALLGQWFVKAGLKNDAPAQALGILTKAIIRSAQPANLTRNTAEKLWAVYKALVEFHHGNYMDELKEREAIRLLGVECAKLQVTTLGDGENVYMGLRQALTDGTSDDSDFSSGYSNTLLHLRMQSRQSRR
jgi:tetratricopeptide (TPR) repeat protein